MGMIGNSLAQGLISGANIQDGTVDTPDIKDSAVTAAKIASAVVTPAKMDFSAGTANGVLFLNGSKVASSGSALVFDGTNFGVGTSSPNKPLDVVISATGDQSMVSLRTTGASGQGLLLGVNTTNSVTTIKNNASSTYGMAFYAGSGSAEHMRLDSAGNLGVGTTTTGGNRFISRYNTGGTDPTESIGAFVLGNDATFTGGILRVKNAGNRGARGHANGSGLFNFEFSDAAGASLDKDGVFCIGKTGWNHNSGFAYHPALYSSGVGVLELAANSNSNSQTALQLYSNSDSTYKFYVQWDGETYIAGPLKLAQPTNAKNEIKVGSLPSWGTSGKTFFTAVGEYGYSNNGLILQCGYDDGGDVGGIKITDDGICMWGAGDEDLLRIYNEDSNVLALQIADNNNAVFSGSVTPNSDESLKTNWRDVCEDFVEQLANLKHGIYDRTDMTEKDGTPYTQVGVGAQSLETFFPEGVYRSKTTGLLGVDYGGVAMVSAVELAKEVVALKAIIESLTERITALETP
jgi:hypothetical protein